MDPKRLRILDAVAALLATILTANGYRTDAGQYVQIGEIRALGPDDVDYTLGVLPQEDIVVTGLQAGKIVLGLPINVAGILRLGLTDAGRARELLIADVKQAMESRPAGLMALLKAGFDNPDGLMRGTTETFNRTSGADSLGFQITYVLQYSEAWGDPEA